MIRFIQVASILTLWLILALSCQSNVSIQTAQYAVNGHKLYITHCQNCHGAKGEGLGKLYPPLTDHQYLSDNRQALPSIIKKGMKGEITINGQLYDEIMPANPSLTDIEIAYILTYITTHFGNSTETYSLEEVNENL